MASKRVIYVGCGLLRIGASVAAEALWATDSERKNVACLESAMLCQQRPIIICGYYDTGTGRWFVGEPLCYHGAVLPEDCVRPMAQAMISMAANVLGCVAASLDRRALHPLLWALTDRGTRAAARANVENN